MYRLKERNLKRGLVIMALLFTVILCPMGCGKADKAYEKAMKLAEEGKYQEASESFQTAIEHNGDKAEYYIAYGMTLNHMGEYEKAIKQFEQAYQEVDNKISRKNNKQLYYGEALAYYGLQQFEEAIECCELALDIKDESEINGNIYAAMAASQWLSGNSEDALDSYNQLIKNNKKDIQGYLQRGRLYVNIEDTESALKDFTKAIQLDSKCYEAYFAMYDVYLSSGQEDAAQESLEKLLKLKAKSAEEKMQLGRAYSLLGKEEEAVRYLEDAVQGKCVEGNYYLGLLQMDKQDYQAALAYFEKYVQTASVLTIADVYNQLAGCLIESGDYEAAEKYLLEGLELGMTDAYPAMLRNQVILLEKLQDFSAAKEAAEIYMQAFPQDTDMKKELEFIKTRIKNKKSDAETATGAGASVNS